MKTHELRANFTVAVALVLAALSGLAGCIAQADDELEDLESTASALAVDTKAPDTGEPTPTTESGPTRPGSDRSTDPQPDPWTGGFTHSSRDPQPDPWQPKTTKTR